MSSLLVDGFEKMILKKVRVFQKEGKAPVVFVEFIDFATFESTGDLIYRAENMNVDMITSLKSLEKKPVKATILANVYNGRSSFVVKDIKAA